MADVLTPEQRHRCMSRIKGKDTKPEMIVRRMVHAMGYRFRLHRKGLPGKPDLVFGPRRRVIFVHGCFWHVHDCKYGQVKPKTNASFWGAKRGETRKRDQRNIRALEAEGWQVLVIWECETRDGEALEKRLAEFLS